LLRLARPGGIREGRPLGEVHPHGVHRLDDVERDLELVAGAVEIEAESSPLVNLLTLLSNDGLVASRDEDRNDVRLRIHRPEHGHAIEAPSVLDDPRTLSQIEPRRSESLLEDGLGVHVRAFADRDALVRSPLQERIEWTIGTGVILYA